MDHPFLRFLGPALLAVLVAVWAVGYARHKAAFDEDGSAPFDEVEYRDVTYKLPRVYESFEAFANDPDRYHPDDVARLEQALRAADAPDALENGGAVLGLVFNLMVPGYGFAGLQTALEEERAESAENEPVLMAIAFVVPGGDVRRVVVYEGARNGPFAKVDDFYDAGEPAIAYAIREDGARAFYDGDKKLKFRRPPPAAE